MIILLHGHPFSRYDTRFPRHPPDNVGVGLRQAGLVLSAGIGAPLWRVHVKWIATLSLALLALGFSVAKEDKTDDEKIQANGN